MLIISCRDILRVITIPEQVNESNVLLPGCTEDESRSEEGNAFDDGEVEADEAQAEEEERQMRDAKVKRKGLPKAPISTKKRRPTRLFEQVFDVESHKKVFGKAWIALLSCRLIPSMHKLALKHLPTHVIPFMHQPLLLADYLTNSYALGGVIAVLSLESLFHLIAKCNLDYPHFFESLYRLCTANVFSAKYRGKFMRLASLALRSTNLSAYLAAGKILIYAYSHDNSPVIFSIYQAIHAPRS